jgi:hypothetical protein
MLRGIVKRQSTFEMVSGHGEVLTFDVDRTIPPRIGFECFIDHGPDPVSGWSVFLDHLIDKGLCTRA